MTNRQVFTNEETCDGSSKPGFWGTESNPDLRTKQNPGKLNTLLSMRCLL